MIAIGLKNGALHFSSPPSQTNLLTAGLFPGACFAIASLVNSVALAYGSLAAVPFRSVLAVLLLWVLLSLPLCTAGTLWGRRRATAGGGPSNPCRVKRIPSTVPARGWHLRPAAVAAAAGLLPFGSIFIEMHFIFSSFWCDSSVYAGDACSK